MKIEMLKDRPEFVETVIEWLNNEFGNSNSLKFYQGIIEHSMVENQLPITFIAVENDILLGTVGIWRGDLLSRQELYPWLSALVVNPNYRNKGIGQRLQKYVLEYCKMNGYKEVFLYTDLHNYYEKSGWIPFDKGYEYTGNEVCIYRQSL